METQRSKLHFLRRFLDNAMTSSELRLVEQNLEAARKLMSELEASVLGNPFVTEEQITQLANLSRSPLWHEASRHLESLKHRSYRLCLANE